MAGNTLGDLLKAGQLDLLKQVSSDSKSASKKSVAEGGKSKNTTSPAPSPTKSSVSDEYKIFHSYVKTVVQKSELYDTMFDYGEDESFAAISELYDDPVSRDIIDYFACRFFDGEYDYLDSIATECEQGNDSTPDEYAVVLGHKIPITYREEYELLSSLCSTALNLDGHFDDDPVEETVIVYNRTSAPTSSFPEQQYTPSYQNHSATSVTKQENTKALRKAQDVVNVPKKGSQIQHVKVVKQPAVPKQLGVKKPASIPVRKHNQPVPLVSPAVKQVPANPAKKNKPFVAPEWQQFITDHTPSQPKAEKLDEVLGKQLLKNQTSSDTEIKVEKVDPHQRKTQHVFEQFSNRFHMLGVTDIVVELYSHRKFQAILSLFRNDFWKQYSIQVTLDQSSYKSLWEDAHNFMFEFILGRKRFASNSVVSFRKRSFSSHIANSGVWGRMAAYGGTNGRIIRINAGHGRR